MGNKITVIDSVLFLRAKWREKHPAKCPNCGTTFAGTASACSEKCADEWWTKIHAY